MINLFKRFVEIWIVGADGVPRQVIPHHLGHPIEWDSGDLVRLSADSSVQLVGTLRAGQTVQIIPPSYSGTGPISYQSTLRLNGQVIAQRTDFDPFTITLSTSGQLTWTAQAQGAHPTNPPEEYLDWIVEAANIPIPEFERLPSISPHSGIAGDTFIIDPGSGVGLTWELFFDQIDVTDDVELGQYIPTHGGQLRLFSTLFELGQVRTAEATATVEPPTVALWDVRGGVGAISFLRMPKPGSITASGGQESIYFEETPDA